jgi:hypothetical protein
MIYIMFVKYRGDPGSFFAQMSIIKRICNNFTGWF